MARIRKPPNRIRSGVSASRRTTQWRVLREIVVHPLDEPFVARTRHKYASQIHGLRKTFEAPRGEDMLLKKQANGDNVDFDAFVMEVRDYLPHMYGAMEEAAAEGVGDLPASDDLILICNMG